MCVFLSLCEGTFFVLFFFSPPPKVILFLVKRGGGDNLHELLSFHGLVILEFITFAGMETMYTIEEHFRFRWPWFLMGEVYYFQSAGERIVVKVEMLALQQAIREIK